ncbi:hypothetical protein BIW11_03560 [Tropilaelaps mercedesae]|uniref:Uncharacterized protein n=1 Tax=Tropilaelaps mercedesae TaxID=418985 RepID=A0A1V9XJ43_9ACAR|nr:hypothetical protein BIW11_03560 [Tropilaelaps mercedesae]
MSSPLSSLLVTPLQSVPAAATTELPNVNQSRVVRAFWPQSGRAWHERQTLVADGTKWVDVERFRGAALRR